MAKSVEVEEINGIRYYSVETPGGNPWSWDEEDLDAAYIEYALS